MGSVGNGRRVGRTPPLLLGALVACLLLLGFNYWVSNSRNVELQAKLYELEGAARRAAAESVVLEQKHKDVMEQLQQQVELLEKQHNNQRQAAETTWRQEKEILLLNISTSTKTISTMKNQFSTLFDNLGKMQKALQECQKNQSIIEKKLTVDLTRCNKQILVLQGECTAKLAAPRDQQTSESLPAQPVIQTQTNSTSQNHQNDPLTHSPEATHTQHTVDNRVSVQTSHERETNTHSTGKSVFTEVKETLKHNSTERVELQLLDTFADGGTETLADYKGDEQNVGEFEADKEAQLSEGKDVDMELEDYINDRGRV